MSENLNDQAADILPNVAVIGGGTGNFTVLSGLRPVLGEKVSAIVNVVDDGGSTGMLRDQYGSLPAGDARQCLVALSEESTDMRDLFNFRFPDGREGVEGLKMNGQNLGNLVISAAEHITGDYTEAIKMVSRVLNISGRVIPVTRDNRRLVLTLPSGEEIHGEHIAEETNIPSLKGSKVGFNINPTTINPEADEAIRNADLTVIAPGDFYTSIAPALAPEGMKEALQATKHVVLFTNLMNRSRHTAGFTVADFVEETHRVIGDDVIDYVVYNTERPSQETLSRYAGEDEYVVSYDIDELAGAKYTAIGRKLLSHLAIEIDPKDILGKTRSLIRHDPLKIARAVLAINYLNGDQED